MPATRSKLAIGRIQVPKASAILAEHLREGILGGVYAAGEPLPTERDLAETSGLSRASVREALRMLEVEGLVATRPGRSGGSVPQLPGHDALERAIALFIRGQRIRFGALLEVREAIEPPLARLAALNRTVEDVAALEAIQRNLETAFDDVAAWTRNNIDWHTAVVMASHNDLLIAFWKAIGPVRYAASGIDEPHNSPDVREAVLTAHRRVVEAIAAGDAAAAERRMTRHIGAYVQHIRTQASPDIELTSND
jgi:GntR family transcriptional repressor for pyruvate dehydrogenase complex